MKGILKKSLVMILALSMFLAAPVQTSALTLQEQSYLSHLWPKTLPHADESYPARLLVTLSMESTDTTTLRGSLGRNAALTDEEKLAMLKQALSGQSGNRTLRVQPLSGQGVYGTLQVQTSSGQSGYKTLQDVVDERTRIRELTEKLSFTQEDMDAIAANLRQMLGVDELWDVVNGELPGYGADDAIDMALSAAQGENPLSLKPGLGGIFISTLFVTWEEMQNDKQKYADIISLSQANERLRGFYSAFGAVYKQYMTEHGDWSLTIYDQASAPFTYSLVTECGQIWTADIALKKTDEDIGNVTGSYTGRFLLRMDGDLLAADSSWHIAQAKDMNEGGNLPPGVSSVNPITWTAVSNEGAVSELFFAFEIPDCTLSLSLPPGVSRTFFEISIHSESLVQTEFRHFFDRGFVINGASRDTKHIWEYHLTIEDGAVFDYDTSTAIGPAGEVTTSNNSSGGSPTDMRPFVSLKLIIDML